MKFHKKIVALLLLITTIFMLSGVTSVEAKSKKYIPVKSIQLGTKSITLDINQTHQLNFKVLPTNATNKKVRYSTSNSKVAIVNGNGRITAKGIGSANITVTSLNKSKKAIIKVTVKKATPSPQLTLGYKCLNFLPNESYRLNIGLDVRPGELSNEDVILKSSDTNIAVIDAEGKITAKAPGTANIIVTHKASKQTVTLKVNVLNYKSSWDTVKQNILDAKVKNIFLKTDLNCLYWKPNGQDLDSSYGTIGANGRSPYSNMCFDFGMFLSWPQEMYATEFDQVSDEILRYMLPKTWKEARVKINDVISKGSRYIPQGRGKLVVPTVLFFEGRKIHVTCYSWGVAIIFFHEGYTGYIWDDIRKDADILEEDMSLTELQKYYPKLKNYK